MRYLAAEHCSRQPGTLVCPKRFTGASRSEPDVAFLELCWYRYRYRYRSGNKRGHYRYRYRGTTYRTNSVRAPRADRIVPAVRIRDTALCTSLVTVALIDDHKYIIAVTSRAAAPAPYVPRPYDHMSLILSYNMILINYAAYMHICDDMS